jgi:hypothetical protein
MFTSRGGAVEFEAGARAHRGGGGSCTRVLAAYTPLHPKEEEEGGLQICVLKKFSAVLELQSLQLNRVEGHNSAASWGMSKGISWIYPTPRLPPR